jgi:protein-L-isoaspartate(D-aspartate) O-methyltransferase
MQAADAKRGALLLLAAALILAHSSGAAWAQDSEQNARQAAGRERETMVRDQIEARGIHDRRVLAAMRAVPRDQFVPAELAGEAHADHPLPIGHRQTISQPYIVAYMSALLQVSRKQRVLEIGAGSGYQAAVLGKLAKEVFTIERIEPLAEQAKAKLAELGYDNVHVRFGDGYVGWPEEAPFDRILVTAAPPEIPAALIEQLAPGGRLVAPVGAAPDLQRLVIIEKDKNGVVSRREDLGVRFVPMLENTERAP